jgi:hypothetical protein
MHRMIVIIVMRSPLWWCGVVVGEEKDEDGNY